jgi:hypothetical protein
VVIAGQLIGERIHLVRRGAEKKDLGMAGLIGVAEESLRQLAFSVLGIEKILKPLKLI